MWLLCGRSALLQGPPGPLGVVNPQASPPVVLGGPTQGPVNSTFTTGSDVGTNRVEEVLMQMPYDLDEEVQVEEEPVIRRGSRVRRRPDLYVPGAYCLTAGRSRGLGEITGSGSMVLGSRKWTLTRCQTRTKSPLVETSFPPKPAPL